MEFELFIHVETMPESKPKCQLPLNSRLHLNVEPNLWFVSHEKRKESFDFSRINSILYFSLVINWNPHFIKN